MKRIIGLLLCLCTIFSLCFALTSCQVEDINYIIAHTQYTEDGIGILNGWIVMVISYDATGEYAEVIIPDEFHGKKVQSFETNVYTCLLKPCGENIIGSDIYGEDRDIDYEERYVDNIIEERTFNLQITLGKNINYIHGPWHRIFYKKISSNEYIKYFVNILWVCSQDNEKYYSRDGKLYYKDSNKLYNEHLSVYDKWWS